MSGLVRWAVPAHNRPVLAPPRSQIVGGLVPAEAASSETRMILVMARPVQRSLALAPPRSQIIGGLVPTP